MSARRLAFPLALAAALCLFLPGQSLAAEPQRTFSFTGSEQSYVVPVGVQLIHVVAIGAKGGKGAGAGGPGGSGAKVEADLAVQPGEQLFVEVGGKGDDGTLNGHPAGGFNGGGSSTAEMPGGGGGGATDLRTCPRPAPCPSGVPSLGSRVLVAAGGGGGGALGRGQDAAGGEGGDGGGKGAAGRTASCNPGEQSGSGGEPGTQDAGGAGGVPGGLAAEGEAGVLGLGGDAGVGGIFTVAAGGGGGGGLFGGGGGGSGCTGAGGGGGSSFAGPVASHVAIAVDPTDAASVVISIPAGDGGGGGAPGGGAGGPGAGRAGASRPPQTNISKHPPRKTALRSAGFAFSSDQPGSSFQCKLDRAPFESCGSIFKRKVKRGRHTFQVRAVNSAGLADPSPAVFRWKVS
jgi:hypothetical protein